MPTAGPAVARDTYGVLWTGSLSHQSWTEQVPCGHVGSVPIGGTLTRDAWAIGRVPRPLEPFTYTSGVMRSYLLPLVLDRRPWWREAETVIKKRETDNRGSERDSERGSMFPLPGPSTFSHPAGSTRVGWNSPGLSLEPCPSQDEGNPRGFLACGSEWGRPPTCHPGKNRPHAARLPSR